MRYWIGVLLLAAALGAGHAQQIDPQTSVLKQQYADELKELERRHWNSPSKLKSDLIFLHHELDVNGSDGDAGELTRASIARIEKRISQLTAGSRKK